MALDLVTSSLSGSVLQPVGYGKRHMCDKMLCKLRRFQKTEVGENLAKRACLLVTVTSCSLGMVSHLPRPSGKPQDNHEVFASITLFHFVLCRQEHPYVALAVLKFKAIPSASDSQCQDHNHVPPCLYGCFA